MTNPENHTLANTGAVTAIASDDYSVTLDVDIIRPGVANGLAFSPELLEAAAPLFHCVPCFIDHALPGENRPGGRSLRDLAGLVMDPRWDPATQAITARLRLTDPRWLPVIRAFADYPQLVGLSADLWLHRSDGSARPSTVTAIDSVNSVDMVIRPAAGGRFLTTGPITPSEEPMAERTPATDKTRVQLGTDPGTAVRVQTADNTTEPPATNPPEAHPPAQPATVPLATAIQLALQASNLPEPLHQTVLDTNPMTLDAALATIRRLSDQWAQATAQAAVRNLGRVSNMTEPIDRITLAFERLMGIGDTPAHHNAPRLSGIRELYDILTGDWDRHGLFYPDRVTFANATTTTMAEVTRNVLNKVMLGAFEARPQWWKPIATEVDLPTTQAPKWITLGGFSDLDTVAEGNAYTEKTWDDYAETSAWVKKGNYLGITLEMIDRDDVQSVAQLPRKLGHAAWRTLSSTVSALFTANSGLGPQLADGEKLFDDLAHHNLGSTALASAAWAATVTAMFEQTEYHSAKTLGIRPSFLLVPIELESTAVNLFTTTLEPGLAGNDRAIANVTHSVITVPEWTDANNWAAAAHPMDLATVMIGYRYGRAPELFVAADPATGSMFTNDEMRIKVRFLTTVGIGDYRGLYKHNVT